MSHMAFHRVAAFLYMYVIEGDWALVILLPALSCWLQVDVGHWGGECCFTPLTTVQSDIADNSILGGS